MPLPASADPEQQVPEVGRGEEVEDALDRIGQDLLGDGHPRREQEEQSGECGGIGGSLPRADERADEVAQAEEQDGGGQGDDDRAPYGGGFDDVQGRAQSGGQGAEHEREEHPNDQVGYDELPS